MSDGPATRVTARILGCGSSGGVPRIGNIWGACDPQNPKNRRRRCSLLITGTREDSAGATRILIDAGPDLREQMLDANVPELDAVFFTHEHADHTHGIDDLRVLALNARRRVDVYMTMSTEGRLRDAFGYCFTAPQNSPYPPILNAHSIADGEAIEVEGEGGTIAITGFEQQHGSITSLGFRVGRFAYSCDLSGLPGSSAWAVKGLDTWVLDALRYETHPSHLNLEESLDLIENFAPRRAILTNLHVDLDYTVLDAETPANVEPAFDGMEFEIAL
ncbi:MBL fold metallo-hydrolase [Pelagibacterium luteolum]|uniref:Phosphoribosyl 1,2-cyclic phosphate phosphodiesterase n=1 Tax=Pelagibacterium luteolum TaxID=440168 RepID=A0A1G7Z9J2_9HYPH|nr:MBL fold metallo-hydrolase [Pelagibacterium luteolum]SDH05432.1 phosphoribosyl 1,2-cyclic phosphate phosphodiesterase [Pelagibacterium luteolum]